MRGTAEWYQRDWDQPGFGVSLALDHTGGYEDSELQSGRSVDALTTLDIRLSYRTPTRMSSLSDVEFGLNAMNVFDHAPPFVNRETGYDMQNADLTGAWSAFQSRRTGRREDAQRASAARPMWCASAPKSEGTPS